MAYEQNEWITDMDDALAPIEEPEYRELSAAEFDSMLKHAWELKELERKAIEGAKSSWKNTKLQLRAMGKDAIEDYIEQIPHDHTCQQCEKGNT